jgi:hypothetical protein
MLKAKPFRSRKYLDWVKTQPCVFCSQPADDPHHVKGLPWGLAGGGMTAPDSYAMPLCRPHHNLVHAEPAIQRMQPEWLLWTLNKALKQAWPKETREALLEAREFVQDRMEECA